MLWWIWIPRTDTMLPDPVMLIVTGPALRVDEAAAAARCAASFLASAACSACSLAESSRVAALEEGGLGQLAVEAGLDLGDDLGLLVTGDGDLGEAGVDRSLLALGRGGGLLGGGLGDLQVLAGPVQLVEGVELRGGLRLEQRLLQLGFADGLGLEGVDQRRLGRRPDVGLDRELLDGLVQGGDLGLLGDHQLGGPGEGGVGLGGAPLGVAEGGGLGGHVAFSADRAPPRPGRWWRGGCRSRRRRRRVWRCTWARSEAVSAWATPGVTRETASATDQHGRARRGRCRRCGGVVYRGAWGGVVLVGSGRPDRASRSGKCCERVTNATAPSHFGDTVATSCPRERDPAAVPSGGVPTRGCRRSARAGAGCAPRTPRRSTRSTRR